MDLIKLLEMLSEERAKKKPSVSPLKEYFARLNDGVREICLYPAIDIVADSMKPIIKAEMQFAVDGSRAVKTASSEMAANLVKRGFFQTHGGALNFVEAIVETVQTQIRRGEETVIAIGKMAHTRF